SLPEKLLSSIHYVAFLINIIYSLSIFRSLTLRATTSQEDTQKYLLFLFLRDLEVLYDKIVFIFYSVKTKT
ncbi:MAG: hypothetical protein Q4A09_00625, partial [Capnocytophaga felis]|nr:hypothetical protein [Capnocytophaga felis]